MKRIFSILCALAIVMMSGSITALASEDTGQSASYYPISVEEYTYGDFDELRINKIYQLSLSDDPSLIPTDDFVRNGRRYYLLDMTRKDEVGVDIQTHTETVTKPSDTNSLEKILQQLDAEMERVPGYGRRGQSRHPLHRHRQLHWHRFQPLRHRLHGHRQLHRRGVQGRLQCRHVHRDLRQREDCGGARGPRQR